MSNIVRFWLVEVGARWGQHEKTTEKHDKLAGKKNRILNKKVDLSNMETKEETQRKVQGTKTPMNKEKYAEMITRAYDKKRIQVEQKLELLGENATVEEIEEILKQIQQLDGAEYRLQQTLNKVKAK